MTVIKGNKTYFIKPGSAQASDTESLNLGSASASDTESVNEDSVGTTRHGVFRALPPRPIRVEDSACLKKSSGKRKIRRYQNRCILQTLEEENEPETTLVVIVDSYKGPFSRLLENPEAMKFWNDFVEKTEEEQNNIINAFSERHQKCNLNSVQNTDSALGRISSRVKRTFRTKKNLSVQVVRDCECQLLHFFNTTPEDVFIRSPGTSFERLLVKAIAHYHGLQIKSTTSSESSKPSIEIFNTNKNWVPANCFLTDFIQQLREDYKVS